MCENEQIAKEILIRKEMIARLEQEIKELKVPSIGELLHDVEVLVISTWKEETSVRFMNYSFAHDVWPYVNRIAINLHRGNHPNEKRLNQKALSESERIMSAEMAKEMFKVWDRYVQLAYGFTIADLYENPDHPEFVIGD